MHRAYTEAGGTAHVILSRSEGSQKPIRSQGKDAPLGRLYCSW